MNNQNASTCILIAEDEALVAMLLEDLLGAAGYKVVLAETLSTAMAAAEAESLDVAILDVMLGRDQSFPLADFLHARRVPFLFASGHGRDGIPDRFDRVPVLQKPYDMKALQTVLASLLGSAA